MIVSCLNEIFVPLRLEWAGLPTRSLELDNQDSAARDEEYAVVPPCGPQWIDFEDQNTKSPSVLHDRLLDRLLLAGLIRHTVTS